MPKKTKRQKLAIERHKSEQTTSHFVDATQRVIELNTPSVQRPTFVRKSITLPVSDISVFKHDLIKTLMISIGLLCIEYVLYTAQSSYHDILKRLISIWQ